MNGSTRSAAVCVLVGGLWLGSTLNAQAPAPKSAPAPIPALPAPDAAPAPAPASKLALTLTLDKTSYPLAGEALAEVRLDNHADREATVLELQLEARSLSFELLFEGKSPIVYTVNRPNVFFNTNAGPTRVALPSKKALVTMLPLPLVRAGKLSVTAVYKGGGPATPSLRSNAVSAEVKAERGANLIVKLETVTEGQAKPAKESGKGVIAIQLDPEAAPVHVMNFLFLARQGFYDRLSFFRVIQNFLIQTGCPNHSGIGDPGYNIANEYKPEQKHVRGTVSMNHPKDRSDAAGSQFFICVKDAPWLDLPDERYTVFGRVVEGIDTAEEISKVDADPKTHKPHNPVIIQKVTIETK
jgi:cyclophilin family peptidyl-prolyl cis-trans isomerase